jgi:hypothetical protein
MITGDADLNVWQCIEIADLCIAANKPMLIAQFLRKGCHPKEVERRLAILAAPAEHAPSTYGPAREEAIATRFGR